MASQRQDGGAEQGGASRPRPSSRRASACRHRAAGGGGVRRAATAWSSSTWRTSASTTTCSAASRSTSCCATASCPRRSSTAAWRWSWPTPRTSSSSTRWSCCSASRSRSRSACARPSRRSCRSPRAPSACSTRRAEDFRIQLVQEDEEGEEVLYHRPASRPTPQPDHQARRLDHLQRHPAPRVRHPHRDARHRGASSSTASTACSTRRWSRSTSATTRRIITRIKVMSELDIAEKRVPQDGRFKLRSRAARSTSASRSCPPSTARTAVIRILDKESMNEEFKNLRLDVLGFDDETMRKLRKLHPRALRHGAGHRPDRPRQDDHALRRALRDPDLGGQDHHHRGPGRVPAAAASPRSRSTRRRA